MKKKNNNQKPVDIYDDGNIPEIDLPHHRNSMNSVKQTDTVEPLPESERPRKDGPGGD